MSNILSPIVDGVWAYGRWFLSAWVDLKDDKEVIKKDYDKVKEINEFDEMKKEIKEYENKIKSLNMPKMITYKHIWVDPKGNLKACIGEDINEEYLYINFTQFNHLGLFGMSGAGKSSVLRCILLNLMLNFNPGELEFILVDYKELELPLYEDYLHVIGTSVENEDRFIKMLAYLEKICNERKVTIKSKGYKGYVEYNKFEDNKINPIIVVIDEVAQVLTDKKMQTRLHKIISLVRAYGIIFIICSQEASKETIGKLKINLMHTIGLKAHDKTDSDVIIKGANLQDLPCMGRIKYECMGNITECQSFYVIEEDVKGYLKDFKK